jgi:hypothetical protein
MDKLLEVRPVNWWNAITYRLIQEPYYLRLPIVAVAHPETYDYAPGVFEKGKPRGIQQARAAWSS